MLAITNCVVIYRISYSFSRDFALSGRADASNFCWVITQNGVSPGEGKERGGEPYKGRVGGCGKELLQGWPSLEMGGVCNAAGCPETSPAPQEKKERILHADQFFVYIVRSGIFKCPIMAIM